ncbi:MAG: response regulator transcription factor [Caulobacteraceae bacterium]|nr:response regulator transcription factor [Caulobacteraceae bacterium]
MNPLAISGGILSSLRGRSDRPSTGIIVFVQNICGPSLLKTDPPPHIYLCLLFNFLFTAFGQLLNIILRAVITTPGRPRRGQENIMSPTILIVDDHELTARALRLRICAAIPHCDVVIAPTLVSAMQQAIRLRRLSLVLLDLMLPDARGYSGLLLMRQLTRAAPIALISARQDQATIAKARSLGAAGFLSKSLSPLAMTDAVCAMLRGDTAFPEQVDEDDQTTILREQLDRTLCG